MNNEPGFENEHAQNDYDSEVDRFEMNETPLGEEIDGGNDHVEDENCCHEPDDSMDGDFDSGMASAGLGTNEDYGDYGQSDEGW